VRKQGPGSIRAGRGLPKRPGRIARGWCDERPLPGVRRGLLSANKGPWRKALGVSDGIAFTANSGSHPAGDEPLESGAGTLRAACPTLGRQERRITGGADDPTRRQSAECARLAHDRSGSRSRHHATTFAARTARRTAGRLLHRHPAGGLAGLCLRGRTRRGASHTRRPKLHERRTAAAIGATETTAAPRGGREAAEGDHEAQGTAHVWHLHTARPGTTHRRTRCVVHDDASKP
jgi:hypothetical protein